MEKNATLRRTNKHNFFVPSYYITCEKGHFNIQQQRTTATKLLQFKLCVLHKKVNLEEIYLNFAIKLSKKLFSKMILYLKGEKLTLLIHE